MRAKRRRKIGFGREVQNPDKSFLETCRAELRSTFVGVRKSQLQNRA